MSHPSLLVVDDDAGMVETLADILGATGYTVATALSGEAAVAMVRSTRYDAALMDIQMPGMNGVEALEAFRPFAPDLPVFFMTAFMKDELAVRAHRGAVAVLSKPLNVLGLLTLIDETIWRRPGRVDEGQ